MTLDHILEMYVKYGPEWLLIIVLVSIIFYLFKNVLAVVKSNTAALSKFTEIVSHCTRRIKND